MNLFEAFKALDALNEDTFSVSDDGIAKLDEFQNDDELTDDIDVIDTEAETEDDLQDSYVGKVILDCGVCHSKIYKDKEEVELNEDQTLANVGEECPFCSTSDGFKIIGQVEDYSAENDEPETTDDEQPAEDDDDAVEESLSVSPIKDDIRDDKTESLTDTLAESIFGPSKKKKAQMEREREEREYQERQNQRKKDSQAWQDWCNQANANAAANKQRQDAERRARAEMRRADRERISKYSTGGGNTGHGGVHYSGGDYWESLKEAAAGTLERPMSAMGGTLSNVMTAHKDELSSIFDRESAISFLDAIEPEVKNKGYLNTVRTKLERVPNNRISQFLYNIILKGDGMGTKMESIKESKSINEVAEVNKEDMIKAINLICNGRHSYREKLDSYLQYRRAEAIENLSDRHLRDFYNEVRDELKQEENPNFRLAQAFHLDESKSIKEGVEYEVYFDSGLSDEDEFFTDLRQAKKYAKELVKKYGPKESDAPAIIKKSNGDPLPDNWNVIDKIYYNNESKSMNEDVSKTVPGTLYKVMVKGKDEFLLTEYFDEIVSYLDSEANIVKDFGAVIYTLSDFTFNTTPYLEYNGSSYQNLIFPDTDSKSVIYKDGVCKTALSAEEFKTPSKSNIKNYTIRLTNDIQSIKDGVIISPANEQFKSAVKTDKILHLFDTEQEALDYVEESPRWREMVSLNESKSIQESVNNVNVETDDSIVNVSSDENGKVTVTTEPITATDTASEGGDVLAPIDAETEDTIVNGSSGEVPPVEDSAIEEPVDGEEIDAEVDEFVEESFNHLCGNYLREVYDNVESFETSEVKENDKGLVVEGLIKFDSGNIKKTSFILEAKDCTRSGHCRFVGSNKHLSESADPYLITGKISGGKLICESLSYNYTVDSEKYTGIVRRG